MVAADQPTIFGLNAIAALSSKEDGNLKFGLGNDEAVLANRKAFLKKAGIAIEDTSLVSVTYDTSDFAKYKTATVADKTLGILKQSDTNYADALVSTEPNHALFLPLADCAGAILYDPEHRVVMVSHLGRHSVEQHGAEKSVRYLIERFMTRPEKVLVWISPSVGKATYPLHVFDDRGLQEVIIEQLCTAGVSSGNIEASPIDTARNGNYYSHSQLLKGNEAEAGRFAIVAMIPHRVKVVKG